MSLSLTVPKPHTFTQVHVVQRGVRPFFPIVFSSKEGEPLKSCVRIAVRLHVPMPNVYLQLPEWPCLLRVTSMGEEGSPSCVPSISIIPSTHLLIVELELPNRASPNAAHVDTV